VMIIAAIRVFAIGRARLSLRGMGLRRPSSVSEAAVLAASTWLIFLMFAAAWVLLTTPRSELEQQQAALRRERTTPTLFPPPVPTTIPAGAPGVSIVPDPSHTSVAEPATTAPPAASTTPAATPNHDDRHILLKALAHHPPVRVVVLILVSACVLAPIAEELFFRGFLFRTVRSRYGLVAGALSTGALFGLAHASVVPLRMTVPLGVMGIALAWLVDHTGSLVPGIGVHGFVNALGTGISAGFGLHTITLIVGTWAVLGILLTPWLRRPVVGT
jgi:membrane protease YdiL (CAAX protease family)